MKSQEDPNFVSLQTESAEPRSPERCVKNITLELATSVITAATPTVQLSDDTKEAFAQMQKHNETLVEDNRTFAQKIIDDNKTMKKKKAYSFLGILIFSTLLNI